MRDLNAAERKKHIEMIENPQAWPNWPILPMKRYVDGQHDAGFSVTADYPLVVLKGFPTTKGVLLQLYCEKQGLPVLGRPGSVAHADEVAKSVYENNVEARYEDIDGMLDAGWRID